MASQQKIVFVIFLIVSFAGLFPISLRLADLLFTHPYRGGYDYPVLLVWQDHVEIRWFHNLSEVSPRSANDTYTFSVPPEREAWVKNQVANTPAPHGVDAGWVIRIKQIDPSRQRIQLEMLGDGITGLIYEARPDEIVPLQSRLSGKGGAFVILAIQLSVWGGLAWLVRRVALERPSRVRSSSETIPRV